MISNQILQNTLEGLKGITRIDLSVMDTEGKVLAATVSNAEEYENAVLAFVESPADSQVIGRDHLFKITEEGELAYILIARGNNDESYLITNVHGTLLYF